MLCPFYCLAFGGGVFLIGGGSLGFTTLGVSTDGVTWAYPLQGTTNWQVGGVYSVIYGNGVFLAQTAATTLYSRNGQNWLQLPRPIPTWSIYADGLYLGLLNGLVAGKDPLHWSPQNDGPGDWFLFGGGRFLAVSGPNLQLSDNVDKVLTIQSVDQKGVQIALNGLRGFSYDLQFSTNLLDWSTWASATNLEPGTVFWQTNTGPKVFYRAVRH